MKRRSDENMIDEYSKAEAFSKPKEYQYGVQFWNEQEQAWIYRLMFGSLDECRHLVSNGIYRNETRRIVIMSKYYPYPALSVVNFYKGDQ